MPVDSFGIMVAMAAMVGTIITVMVVVRVNVA